MGVKVTGADRLDSALAAVEADATDRNTLLAMAALVLVAAQPAARSTRVRATGRTRFAGKGRAQVLFGSAATPWTAPSHFGHGAPGHPRAQGGWITGNMFLFNAAERERDNVIDLGLRRVVDAFRANGFDVS